MSFLEQAEHFIAHGSTEGIDLLLLRMIQDGGGNALSAVQQMYEDMYEGITYNYYLKSPAAHSLVCWGSSGLQALVEGARRTPRSKNVSLTLEILSHLAAGETPALLDLGIRDSYLAEILTAAFEDPPVKVDEARRLLREYILSLPDDDAAADAVGHSLSMTRLGDVGAAKELFSALAGRWLAVSTPILKDYYRLCREYPEDEPRFQAFFEEHPQILDPMVLNVWPRPDLHGALEPDFVIQRTDNSYLIVEIETPAKSVVTLGNQLSADATRAVAQAIQYRAFLLERTKEAERVFPKFADPECLVVIGLQSELNEAQHRALQLENQSRPNTRIVGFDWLSRRAETIANNVIASDIRLERVRML